MNLGIFGGTFNPIHKGHIGASLRFYDDAKLDMLLIIPDRIPPHKEGTVASAYHRLNMLRLVYDDSSVTGGRNIQISETELKREGKSYTITTLCELKESYPDAKLFLYTGSDMFYTLESWREGAKILSMCTVYTVAREENEQDKLNEYAEKYRKNYGTECIIGDYEPVVSSSTQIRNGFMSSCDKKSCYFTNKLLTDSVNRYIMENSLYCAENTDLEEKIEKAVRELPRLVDQKRYSHILSVVRTAEMIADLFINLGVKLSKDKVKLAALLHDITKCMDQEALCDKYGIVLSNDDKASMQTVHAITGAYYARDVYGIDDEIFNAILSHTVGNENMSLTEKIIFISDYCEETRVHEQCVSSRKKLTDMIDECSTLTGDNASEKAAYLLDYICAEILGKTIGYLKSTDCRIHRKTLSSLRALLDRYGNDPCFARLSGLYL